MPTITRQDRGLLFVLIGPGGAGKNVLLDAIKERYDEITQLATATTRPMRDNERQGREHLFMDEPEFRQMIDKDELLEHQEVTPGRFYGIPRSSVEEKIFNGEHLIADIEVYGARVLRQEYPDDTILIFITVPGDTLDEKLSVLRERMAKRNESVSKKDEQRIAQRLTRARELELPFAAECDYIIVNDDKDKAIEELDAIIQRKLNERRISET